MSRLKLMAIVLVLLEARSSFSSETASTNETTQQTLTGNQESKSSKINDSPHEFPKAVEKGSAALLTKLTHNGTEIGQMKDAPAEYPKIPAKGGEVYNNEKLSIPPQEFPQNCSKLNSKKVACQNWTKLNSTSAIAPVQFPKPYETPHSILQSNMTLQNLSDASEAEDLRKSDRPSTKLTEANDKVPPQLVDASDKSNELPKTQVEYIENGENTEDSRLNETLNSKSRGVPLVRGHVAAILAGVFVVISVLAYIALLSWRRYLENRYGNRQMLVNEEEFNDPNDMGHFSI